MHAPSEVKAPLSLQTRPAAVTGMPGCYVYCIASTAEAADFGTIGLEGQHVHTMPHGDLCALVHHCPVQPYRSSNETEAASWVIAHHQVVRAAWERWGAVVPVAFNTIIAPGPDEQTSEANLHAWLQREHRSLQERLRTLRGTAEYGLQVFWDPAPIAGKVIRENEELQQLVEKGRALAGGAAYMHRHVIERRVKAQMEALAVHRFRCLYDQLKTCADRVQVEKAKEAGPGRQMIINLSCLVNVERYPELEAIAAKMSEEEGHTIRLVGPLPPYSFS